MVKTVRLEIEIPPMFFLVHREAENDENYLIAKIVNQKTVILKRNVTAKNLYSTLLDVIAKESELVPFPIDLTKIPNIIKKIIIERTEQTRENEKQRLEDHNLHFKTLFSELDNFKNLLVK